MRDDFETKQPVVDLLYPSAEKRKAMKRRRLSFSELPMTFPDDLKLESLADQLSRHYQGKITEILTELCDDEETINYRLDILGDLIAMPELAETIRKIIDLLLTNDKTNIYKLTTPDSFTILDASLKGFEAYGECMELMHRLYASKKDTIKSDGIKKLFAFFEGNYENKHYVKLKKECTELRGAITNRIRSVNVAINLDENLVPVSAGIVGYSDKPCEPQPSLFDKIITLGVKNSSQVVMKNLRKKFVDEKEPNSKTNALNMTDKVLFEELNFATKKFVKSIEDILSEYQAIGFEDMYSVEYQLDFYMGAVRMIENAEAKGLKMCRPEILPTDSRRTEIKGLFDPIYFGEANVFNLRADKKRAVVTNDITMDDDAGFYILTGANNGGKTTFVRALGICQVMAQAGLYVPAESCRLSITDFVYTHFPKEEQTGIDTSRFTTEIKDFKTISDTITSRSLLLMNESIQSTTPNECVDIAGQLVRVFCIIGVRGVFATHLNELAHMAEKLLSDPKLRTKPESIIVTVNSDTGERLYKIKKGIPTDTSYANTIFERFGLDIAAIEKRAEK